MASCCSSRLVGSLFVIAALIQCAAGASHTVGGSSGWIVPSGNASFYPAWAASQTFTVGDTLVFTFTAGAHDVTTVTKAAYDACNASSPIGSVITTSPATITLSSAGEHYYLCGFTGHCSGGQKLAINVTGTAPTTAPAPSPSSTATPPTTSPVTSPTTSPSTSPPAPPTMAPASTPPSPSPSSTATPPTTSTGATPPTTDSVPPPPSGDAPVHAFAGFSVLSAAVAVAALFI